MLAPSSNYLLCLSRCATYALYPAFLITFFKALLYTLPRFLAMATADVLQNRAMSSALQTPMMKQYLEIKARYPESILFFRMGDFYEMFLDDALIAARILDITLTSRNKKIGRAHV